MPGSLAVHYDSDPKRRPAHQRAVADGTLPDGYALDEGAGLVYRGSSLVDIVAERPGVSAWRVTRVGDGVREERLEPRLLTEEAAA